MKELEKSLCAKGVSKSYGKQQVLHDLDLELKPGCIYGLVGRNGAGKTTLLGILTGQNTHDTGTVTYGGAPVWENAEVLGDICFSHELNGGASDGRSSLKVRDYLRAGATFYPHWDEAYARALVQRFGLALKKPINKLSKGQMSMVTIVLALASRAPVTLLDEPVAGLDVVARERFYELLVDEFTKTGRTFVVSTHIIEEASDIFEEVIVVDKGRILLKENTQELLERSFHISGHEREVDGAVAGLTLHHTERLGRSKGVTVLLEPGQRIGEGYDVSIQRPNLQKVFVALCGNEPEGDK